jgi:formiminoglutamase
MTDGSDTGLNFLSVTRGDAPLLVSIPHAGTAIPREIEDRLVSPWTGRKDTDWFLDRLYDFAGGLGATVVSTLVSRTVIDVNRDPSGASLYPGQATTELCPTTTFDGEPLYRDGLAPDAAEIEARKAAWFAPYHAALAAEVARLRAKHPAVVIYDCHSIRSVVPRLFHGLLPQFNIGTNGGRSCDARLTAAIEAVADASPQGQGPEGRVTDGRFKGGFITRSLGAPGAGVHAVQMELACRGYMSDPVGPLGEGNWPGFYDPAFAAPLRATLSSILESCLDFARAKGARR